MILGWGVRGEGGRGKGRTQTTTAVGFDVGLSYLIEHRKPRDRVVTCHASLPTHAVLWEVSVPAPCGGGGRRPDLGDGAGHEGCEVDVWRGLWQWQATRGFGCWKCLPSSILVLDLLRSVNYLIGWLHTVKSLGGIQDQVMALPPCMHVVSLSLFMRITVHHHRVRFAISLHAEVGPLSWLNPWCTWKRGGFCSETVEWWVTKA